MTANTHRSWRRFLSFRSISDKVREKGAIWCLHRFFIITLNVLSLSFNKFSQYFRYIRTFFTKEWDPSATGVMLDGKLGVKLSGHRAFVGGLWDEIGKFQFDFMLSRGLRKQDVFLDIACGSLRGGGTLYHMAG